MEAHPEVIAAAPYVDLQALLMYRGKVVPALIHGTDPAFERRISSIDRYLEKGTLDLLEGEADTLLLSDALARKIKAVVPCTRIGISVVGLEVPHAHIHLIPIDRMSDMDFTRTRATFTPSEFEALAERIRQA